MNAWIYTDGHFVGGCVKQHSPSKYGSMVMGAEELMGFPANEDIYNSIAEAMADVERRCPAQDNTGYWLMTTDEEFTGMTEADMKKWIKRGR